MARGLCVGVTTGLIVSIFRWIIDQTMALLDHIYPQMAANNVLLLPYILLMLLISFVLGEIIGPYIGNLVGSGVPQIEAVFLNENEMPWWSILWRKFIGGLLAICPGLMLGREDPCIEMGAKVGQGYAEAVFQSDLKEKRRLQQSGVAAGLSAAFSAPLAGVFFLVEEITFKFKAVNVISALIASLSADLVTLLFFGTKPCLFLPVHGNLPLNAYWTLPLIGIVLGFLAYVYQFVILSLRPLFAKIEFIPRKYQNIIPLLLIIPIGLWNARLLGGSHVLITSLFNQEFEAKFSTSSLTFILVPIVIFLVRFVFSMLSYGSSVPGGIFMPILVLGALLGVIFANLLIHNGIITSTYYPHIIISMAHQVLPMVITVFIAYYVLDLLGGRPIYEALRIQMNFKQK